MGLGRMSDHRPPPSRTDAGHAPGDDLVAGAIEREAAPAGVAPAPVSAPCPGPAHLSIGEHSGTCPAWQTRNVPLHSVVARAGQLPPCASPASCRRALVRPVAAVR